MPEAMTPEQKKAARDEILLVIKNEVAEGLKGIDELIEARYKALDEKGTNRREHLLNGAEGEGEAFAGGDRKIKHTVGALCCALAAAAPGGKATTKKWRDMGVEKGAAAYAAEFFGEDAAIVKSLSSGEFSDGGMLIQGDIRNEFTDLLVPKVAVLSLNPVHVPMPSGTFEAPKITADVTAQYQGEAQEPVPSKPSTGSRNLKSRELVGEIPISNKLIRRGGPEVAMLVERLFTRRMGIKKDQALLAGVGTSFTPKGLYNWAGSSKAATASTSPTFAQVLADVGGRISALEEANVMMSNPGIILSPRVKNFLMFQIVTGLGIPYFLDEMRNGTFLSYDYRDTTSVPSNLGGGANESWMLFADFDNVLYGEEQGLSVTVSQEASYTEGGVTHSAFGRDETLMVFRDLHDITVEHTEAVTLLTGIQWGG